ncbi:Mu homology domain-containing protein [Scheffersomyces xylosifermentans]|uniref:Mu homology domain-containing protein n=1 Tax=Scheffersomyces xylosifermentans TaxID=1304137 RepID=UPI00315D9C73
MISALYILYWPKSNQHSEVLLNRRYRNDIASDPVLISNYEKVYLKLKPEEKVPFLFIRGVSYIYLQGAHDIILLVVSTSNINAMSTVVFLNSFYGILHNYLSSQTSNDEVLKLDRDAIIDNVNLIFELIDECLDFGLVQSTDYNILKEYIKVNANLPTLHTEDLYDNSSDSDHETKEKKTKNKSKSKSKSKSPSHMNRNIKSTKNHAIKDDVIEQNSNYVNSSVLRTYSSAINWRQKGIFYSKNEIYVDIIEDCEFLYDLESESIKRNEVFGTCAVKCYLSGMPVCRVGFNEENISRISTGEDYDERVSLDLPSNQLKLDDIDDEDEDDEEEGAAESNGNVDIEANEEETFVKEESVDLTSQTDDIANHEETSTNESKNSLDGSERRKVQKKSKIPIRNVQFHQCIELATIYKDNLVTFIPPDDKFILMTYHVEQQKQKKKLPLITIKPTYRVIKETNKLQVLCIVNTNFKKRLHCQNLIVQIPINPHIFDIEHGKNTDECLKYRAEVGEVGYKIDTSELLWKIDTINGRQTTRMMAELSLIDTKDANMPHIQAVLLHRAVKEDIDSSDDEEASRKELDRFYGVHGESSSSAKQLAKKTKHVDFNNDIKLRFSIPMLAYSGLRLNYLSVEEEQMKYSCFPWVRYATESNPSKQSNNGENKNFGGQNCDYRFRIGMSCFQLV